MCQEMKEEVDLQALKIRGATDYIRKNKEKQITVTRNSIDNRTKKKSKKQMWEENNNTDI